MPRVKESVWRVTCERAWQVDVVAQGAQSACDYVEDVLKLEPIMAERHPVVEADERVVVVPGGFAFVQAVV